MTTKSLCNKVTSNEKKGRLSKFKDYLISKLTFLYSLSMRLIRRLLLG